MVRSLALAACALAPAAVAQTCTLGFQPDAGFVGASESALPSIAPAVNAGVAWDPDADGPLPPLFVVAGAFGGVDAVASPGVAGWDGQRWRAFGAGLYSTSSSGGVVALAVHDGRLYAAGGFSLSPTGPTLNQVVVWDGAAWQPVASPLSGTITCLASFAGDLYVGGSFSLNVGRDFAKLVANSWQGFAFDTLGPGASNSRVQALFPYQGELLIGGTFPRRLTRWAGSPTSASFGTTLACQFSCTGGIAAFHADASGLYAAGDFRLFPSQTQPGVMKWDGAAWTALTLSGYGTPSARSLTTYQGELILCDGQASNPGHLLRWDGARWAPFGPTQWSGVGAGPVFRSLGEFQGRLVIGGQFFDALDPSVPNFYRSMRCLTLFDGSTFGPMSRAVGGRVAAMLEWQGQTLAVGRFLHAGSQRVDCIALRDADALWQPFPGGGFNHHAWTAALFENRIVVGGQFTRAGGATVNHLARWNGAEWEAMGAGIDAVPSALVVANARLWCAATDQPGRLDPYSSLARWTGDAWEPITPAPGMRRLTALGPDLFANSTSNAVTRIVRWDGAAFVPLPLPPGESGVAILGRLGGFLHGFASRVYRWNGAAWEPAGSLPSAGLASLGPDDVEAGGVLFVSTNAAGSSEEILSWDGFSWGTLGSMPLNPAYGTSAINTSLRPPALARANGRVLAGGAFLYADANRSRPDSYFASFDPAWRPITTAAPPPYQEAAAGDTLSLAWSLAGDAQTYVWLKDGAVLVDGPLDGVGQVAGARAPQLSITGAQAGASGRYWCVARNACGSVTLAPVQVYIPPPCDPDFNADGNADQDDLMYLIAVIAGADNPSARDPDFNHDGNVDQSDVFALVSVLSGGPCP